MKKNLTLLLCVICCMNSCNKENLLIDDNIEDNYKLSQSEVIENVYNFIADFYESDYTTTKSFSSAEDIYITEVLPLGHNVFPSTKSELNNTEIDNLLYIVNLNKGFIIAGADKRTMPIFAYIDNGNFSHNTLKNPENPELLEYIERTIHNIQLDIEDNECYSSLNTKTYPIKERIYALLGEINWGQHSPYNMYCPIDGTQRCPTGCVITAVAQTCAYYKRPSSVYYGDNIPQNPIGTPFNLNLNWDKIIETSNANSGTMPYTTYDVQNGNYNESQAVALFMRYLGLMLEADYSANGTGATFKNATYYLRSFAGIKADTPKNFKRLEVYNHIKGGNIVLFSGYNVKKGLTYKEGHAWIADGVFVSDHDHFYYHYNWGWNGLHNGYFFEDRWNPGRSEFDDNGNVIPQGDYGKDYKYLLKCIYPSI